MRKKTFISFLIIINFATAQNQEQKTPIDSIYLKNRLYNAQTELYDVYKTQSATIIMLGNSITYGVNWNELLGRTDVVNRGIGSDNTFGYLKRLHYVYRLNPKICFIMGGINDIYSDIPVDIAFKNYKNIIDSVRTRKILPIIQSILHVTAKFRKAVEKNPEVEKFNNLLKKYAIENGIEFIDIDSKLSEN